MTRPRRGPEKDGAAQRPFAARPAVSQEPTGPAANQEAAGMPVAEISAALVHGPRLPASVSARIRR